MNNNQRISLLLVVAAVAIAIAVIGGQRATPAGAAPGETTSPGRTLKSITFNTQAYGVDPAQIDRRSLQIVAEENMHIVALEHFTGVGRGSFSDNGHILSTRPDNPWTKWQEAGTGMEPTGETGYFGYCGRDYYSEVAGIGDIMAYESFPAGTCFLVRKGETLYLHTYAHNFSGEHKGFFHHMVRVLYW